MFMPHEVWALLEGPTVLAEMECSPTQEPGKVADRLFTKPSPQTLLKESEMGRPLSHLGTLRGP